MTCRCGTIPCRADPKCLRQRYYDDKWPLNAPLLRGLIDTSFALAYTGADLCPMTPRRLIISKRTK